MEPKSNFIPWNLQSEENNLVPLDNLSTARPRS